MLNRSPASGARRWIATRPIRGISPWMPSGSGCWVMYPRVARPPWAPITAPGSRSRYETHIGTYPVLLDAPADHGFLCRYGRAAAGRDLSGRDGVLQAPGAVAG